MKLLFPISILLICFIANSCVESFETTNQGFQRILVVDGGITDETKSHEIRLNYTSPLNEESATENVTGANVTVTDSQGNTTLFSEAEPGVYLSPENFAGIPDEIYHLFFTIAEGRSYQSNPLKLIKSPPIDSIYGRFESVIIEESNEIEEGIQVFLDANDPSGNSQFYRYEWEETYLNISPRESMYFLDENNNIVLRFRAGLDRVGFCYISDNSKELIIGSSLGNDQSRVSEMPIRFVNTITTDLLRERYSIKIRQYALNMENHLFYQQLRDISESGGSLFDQQVGNINGNITSISDPKEIVLGYFEVAGVSELREFFTPRAIPKPFNVPTFRFRRSCFPEDFFVLTDSALIATFAFERNLRIVSPNDRGPGWIIGPDICTDCTSYAPGTNKRPEFWID